MIGVLSLITITVSLFQHTVSIPGLVSRDLLPPTRTNSQDISEGALAGYLLPVPGGLHSRRLLWFWGNDDDENNVPVSTTRSPYFDGVTTTKRPSRWSRWKSKVGNAFKEFGNDVKEAANATKWAMKNAGRKVKDGFKKGYKKIKMKIMSVDDKLNHFANRLKAQAEKGNEKAIRLLQKLGIYATVEDGKVIRVDVEDEIDSVDNILKEEGILKVTSTTNLVTATPNYIVTNDITQSIPSTDNINSNILSTTSKISTPVDIMGNLRSTNLPNFSTTVKTTTTESSRPASETAKVTTDTLKSTTETLKPTIKISTSQTTTTEPPKPTIETDISTTATPKTTTEIKTTIKISTIRITTTEKPKPTTETVKFTTKTPETTTETPKTTIKITPIEQPFKTDSPSILESGNNDKENPIDDEDTYVDSSFLEEDKDEEVYTPPPFPDVFGDNRVKDRLMELYEKGDFTHSELADLFDPDYYEYYYDYS